MSAQDYKDNTSPFYKPHKIAEDSCEVSYHNLAKNFTPRHAVKVGGKAACTTTGVCGVVLKIGTVRNKRGKFVTLEKVSNGRNKNVAISKAVGVPVRLTVFCKL